MKEYQAFLITVGLICLMLVVFHFIGAHHAGEYVYP